MSIPKFSLLTNNSDHPNFIGVLHFEYPKCILKLTEQGRDSEGIDYGIEILSWIDSPDMNPTLLSKLAREVGEWYHKELNLRK